MNRIALIILVLFNLNFLKCYCANNIDDRELVVIEYINNLSNYSSGNQYEESYENLVLNIFSSKYNRHDSDLFNHLGQKEFGTYLRLIDQFYNNQISVSFSSPEFLECYANENGRELAFYKVQKQIKYHNLKSVAEIILAVDVTERQYKIHYALLNSSELQNGLLKDNCVAEVDPNIELERAHLEKANNLFSNKKYLEAKEMYKMVLGFNPANQNAKDMVSNCNQLLTISNIVDNVNELIKNNNYQQALSYLDKLKYTDKINESIDDNWYNQSRKKCEYELEKQEYLKLIKLADGLFNKGMYQKAIEQYTIASQSNLATSYIQSQIAKCKASDQNYVRKQLATAYNNAVKSKKNYLETFKTYTKYESSGLLKADQYYFMALMMTSKFSKSIAAEMGYNGQNQTHHLAVEYLYKAKAKGYDVSFLENQVFTFKELNTKE